MREAVNRRWIPNDTPCRQTEDGDAGYEVEVVSAKAYDEAMDSLRELCGVDNYLLATKVVALESRVIELSQNCNRLYDDRSGFESQLSKAQRRYKNLKTKLHQDRRRSRKSD